MISRSIVSAGLACAIAWPVVVGAQSIDRRVDANPDGVLEINNPDGDIIVEAWAQREVRVTGDLGDGGNELDVRTAGDRVIIEVSGANRRGGFFGGPDWGGDIDLLIRAPATMALEIQARAADIEIEGMRGEQRIGSISGDVRTEAYARDLRIETVSGDIRVEGREQGRALVRVSAVSGDIRLSDIGGEIWADSVSGDVTIIADEIERAELKSVSGDIRLMAGLSTNARVDAIATSGDIDLDLRGDAAGEYRLETFSGTIDACFGPERSADRGSRFGPGQALLFTEGRSSARIVTRTHSGDVRVCRE